MVTAAGMPVQPECDTRSAMADNVTLTRDGLIATVTLNRPDRRNSLSDPMLTELAAAFAELREDRKSTRLNSSHIQKSRMPSSA